jgi:hypothetical protein
MRSGDLGGTLISGYLKFILEVHAQAVMGKFMQY